MAWMMELASLIFLTDVVLLFSKSVHYYYIFLSRCMLCIMYITIQSLYFIFPRINGSETGVTVVFILVLTEHVSNKHVIIFN